MTTSFGTDGIAMGTSLRHQIAWMWMIAYGDQEGRTPTHGYEVTRHECRRSLVAGTQRAVTDGASHLR
jgi:hypothetical protein